VTLTDARGLDAATAQQNFDAVLVDHSAGADAALSVAGMIGESIARRIVLITPSERQGLAALKSAGFTGYLVKPVRAASLASRLASNETFDVAGGAAEADWSIAPIDNGGDASKSLNVLIAEDNDINALLARSLIAKLGHQPTVAANGEAAFAAWRSSLDGNAPYDLVFMDVHMPGLDGLEATRRIRAAEAEQRGRRVPIVALTANAFAEDRDACLAAGMDGFLVKPLDRERIAATLAGLVGQASLAA